MEEQLNVGRVESADLIICWGMHAVEIDSTH